MPGSSLACCLLVEGREQSTATQFWMRPSSPALSVPVSGVRKRGRELGKKKLASWWEGQVLFVQVGFKKVMMANRLLLLPAGSRLLVDVQVSVMMRGTLDMALTGEMYILSCPNYVTNTKWSAWVTSITLSLLLGQTKTPPSDCHTPVISVSWFFWLIKISSQWVSRLHISHNGAGYCTRIIIKLFIMSQIILMRSQFWKKLNVQMKNRLLDCMVII